MLIRPETALDVPAIHEVTSAAFAPSTAEAPLVDWLRDDPGWLPQLSLVAESGGAIVGHVVCTRGQLDGLPALGLGPLSVLPSRQRDGVGKALMHTVLGAADALREPIVLLLGSPVYYGRFGFGPASALGIVAPNPAWGDRFQARPLSAYAGQTGAFSYAEPFSRL